MKIQMDKDQGALQTRYTGTDLLRERMQGVHTHPTPLSWAVTFLYNLYSAKAFFLIFAIKICHQSVMPFLGGQQSPFINKKILLIFCLLYIMTTSTAHRIPATRQNTALNAIKIRRETAKHPLGVHSTKAETIVKQ